MTTARIPQVPTNETPLRIVGATIIDGTGKEPLPNGEVVIIDGKIDYVGPRRDTALEGATEVDLTGKTIMPGFFDVHVHMGMGIETGFATMAAQFAEERHYAAAETMRDTLMAGVTTIRDLGGLTPGFRNLVTKGKLLGPRAHLAISVISPTGGHVDFHLANGNQMVPMDEGFRIVDTDDEMRVAVRELIRTGADVIKVCTTGGVSSPSDTPHDLGVPAHQVGIAVEEGNRRQGQPVTAHAQGSAGILEAIHGGVASVEHGYEIDDEGIALMIEKGTYLVPTLSSALRVPDPKLVPPFLYAKKVVWSDIARKHVAKAIQAGVKVALGTDAGVCPHGTNLTELGHMVSLGMAPIDAITAGTLNAAKLMRVDDALGSLEQGKLADLVITDVDPLAEIDRLAEPSEIKVVIQGGRVVKDLDDAMPVARAHSALAS